MVAKSNTSLESMASLSALLDGEATHDDIEHLLQCDSAELSRRLEGYHSIHHALHKETFGFELGDSLLLRVQSGLAAEMNLEEDKNQEQGENVVHFLAPKAERTAFVDPGLMGTKKSTEKVFRWPTFLSGMAVAASVSFMIVWGSQMAFLSNDVPSNLLASANVSSSNMVITPLTESAYQPMQFDEVRLQNYLRQHAEQAAMTVGQGMIPMARIVSYPNAN